MHCQVSKFMRPCHCYSLQSISGASATGGVGTRGASGNISTSGGPRKSISLGTIQSAGNIAALHSPKLSLKPEDSQAALGATAAVGTTRDTTGKSNVKYQK